MSDYAYPCGVCPVCLGYSGRGCEPPTKTNVCLECWRDFTVDFLHLDCTGEHVVPKAEADELREWVIGRREFIIRTGQAKF